MFVNWEPVEVFEMCGDVRAGWEFERESRCCNLDGQESLSEVSSDTDMECAAVAQFAGEQSLSDSSSSVQPELEIFLELEGVETGGADCVDLAGH